MGYIKKNFWYLFILTALILLTYSNALNNAFVSDDIAEIVKNPNIGEISNILSRPFGFIRLIFYYLALHIGGLHPFGFRLINVFLHIGNVLLIFAILSRLYNKKVAILTASIFAIHPLLSESITWISGGGYAQYSFFFLASFLFYILSKDIRKYYFLSILFFLFSFMSHPVMPASLVLIYPLFEYCFGNFKKNWLKAFPFALLVIAYVLINLSALPQRAATLQNTHYQERGMDNPLIQIPVAITNYLQLLVVPKDLTLYHSELAYSNFEFILRAVITLAFFIVTILSIKKSKSLFFWLSFFTITLLPTLTPFRFNWIVAERYVYLGSLGLFVVFVLILEWLSKKYRYSLDYTIVVLLLLILMPITMIRNWEWSSEDTLWVATGRTSPSSAENHNNLGDVYGRQGNKEAAIKEFQTAILLKPNYADAYHNLSNAYVEVGMKKEALQGYEKAAQLNPSLWQSYQNIAAIYFTDKDYEKTFEYMQKAIQASPNNLNLYNNLGIIYLDMGDKQKAKDTFMKVLSVDPMNQIANAGLQEANK